ncbi:Serine threonine- kinase CTR1 [Chlorella sorokiniana]|uniref:Serine threonine-kinase CTR1 n=1 Tax=Chlorella sorokiniana TaxID=3076 RepID=A0A2P6THT4_CHLSO|nr:Serine threonine- kinase CTR1 [Chlorella sorokiniana]|eukprot:PRW33836.1 Serine threonine- kinase CTR1 [Chlorella sorokiniana]
MPALQKAIRGGSASHAFHSIAQRRIFSEVYLADWLTTQVAVKVLLVGQVANASDAQRALSLSMPIMQRLEAEASLLASLRHPHIVQFVAICRDPPCIVTEFCAHGSLAEVLAKARSDPAMAAHLTWARRLAMAADAAAGMLYLHTRTPSPVVHRDLKSPNLLVDASWTVTDFGIARIVEDAAHSGGSMAAMNPRWLAPELMQGHRATPASDVYAFSVVLHELLTWQLPWGSTNPWQLVNHVLSGGRLEVPSREALPGPDTAAFGGLEAYISLMQRCWAQEPGQRPAFQQIVLELRALLEQAP